MTGNRGKSTSHLTFSQRNSYEPLPEPMRLEHISDDLRREIWNATRTFLNEITTSAMRGGYFREFCFNFKVEQRIEIILGKILKKPEDEIDTRPKAVLSQFKTIIREYPFNEVLDFFEYFFKYIKSGVPSIRSSVLSGYQNYIRNLFDEHAAAYLLDTSERPFQFIPRSSKEQGEAVQKDLETIREAGMKGASTHLRKAVAKINKRQFPESVRDSIDAVESIARRIDPKASKTLGAALNSLEKKGLLTNPQLKAGLEKLYAYTNSAEGSRHPQVFKDVSDVGLDEAMFMYGACASFAAYLVSKHRQQAEKQGADG